MADPRIRWNPRAFPKIRRLESLRKLEHSYAEAGAEAGGEGFIARSGDRPTRARAAVIAASMAARRRNAREHTLLGPVVDAMKAHRR